MEPAAASAASQPAADDPSVRPGVKTTEFLISLLAFALGAYLILSDKKPELGTELVTWATAGYVTSRAIAKGGLSSILSALRGK